MDGLRLRPWWWLAGAGVAAIAAGVFTLADGSVVWLVVGFVTASASPAVPFVARWWEEHEKRRTSQLSVLGSSVLPRPKRGPASLLAPDLGVVPFRGRAVELDVLLRWCRGQGPPLHLVTGPSGIGKSRIAAELVQRMRREGWHCISVAEEQEATILGPARHSTDKPILLVVDYADTRHRLDALVRQVAAGPGGVRVLLLARSAGDWWQRLKVSGPQVREIIQGAYAGVDLPARIDADITDQQIVTEAASAFARELGVPTPEVRLSSDGNGQRRILDLHAASLVAVLSARGRVPASGPLDADVAGVMVDLLGHEQRYWIGAADHAGLLDGSDGLTVDILHRVVAAMSLTPPADEAEARELLKRVEVDTAAPKVLRWLRDLYPHRTAEHWVGTLQPDRLAELHLVNELSASEPLATCLLDRLDTRRAPQIVAVLARAVADHFADDDVRARAVRLLDRVIVALPDDLDLLRSVSAVFPYPSEALARSDLSVLDRTLGLLDPADTAGRSWVLHDIGIRLYRLGRHARAIGPLTQAVAIRRAAAEADPATYEPHLARSLRYLGVVLSELDRAHDALTPTREAVEIERRLAHGNQNRLPEQARILCDLGARYHEAGLPERAIPLLEQSVRINEGFARRDPARNNTHLARSLMNLAVALRMLDRPSVALPVIERAVEIRRVLARDNPDSDLAFLAHSLTEFSACLVLNARPHDGIDPARESVEIIRRLAEDNPSRHAAGLARSLHQTATALRFAGRGTQASPSDAGWWPNARTRVRSSHSRSPSPAAPPCN